MNASVSNLNRIAACAAAALGIAVAGSALADVMGGSRNPATQQTAPSAATQRSDARLTGLAGATIKDTNGNAVGTIRSYSDANGQVTATVVNPSGVASELPLGPVEAVASELPPAGTVSIVVGADGTVQRPLSAAATESTPVKTPLGKSTTRTTNQSK